MYIRNPLKTLYRLVARKVPVEAQLIVTRRCNLTCGYCTEYDDFSKPIELAVLKQRIDALHRLGVINISMLGGEPLMHPNLPEIVAYSNKESQVSVTTNGFLITEKNIKALNEAGLGNLQVSIDSLKPDPKFYIQKSLKTLTGKLQLLKTHAKFDVHVTVVLCEESAPDFVATLEELKSYGFNVSINLIHNDHGQITVQGEKFIELWDYHYKNSELFSAIEYDYGKELLQGQWNDWHCRAGSRFLYVDEFGKVQLCSSQRGRLDKPILEYTRADMQEQSKQKKGCEIGCSQMCVYRDSQIDNAPLSLVKPMFKILKSINTKPKAVPSSASA